MADQFNIKLKSKLREFQKQNSENVMNAEKEIILMKNTILAQDQSSKLMHEQIEEDKSQMLQLAQEN